MPGPVQARLRCPLCDSPALHAYHRDRHRDYLQCGRCALVFVPPSQHVPAERERAEYALHRNSPDDPGYRRFLDRMLQPMQARLRPGSHGLDFGCGPGPTLSLMFEELGHDMRVYDPFFAADPAALRGPYDFITATEVVEHLHQPGRELDRLWAILRPGGWLGIMTKRVLDARAFAGWHYRNDITHVCFFSVASFEWLAGRWQAGLEVVDRDVVILHKPGSEEGARS